LLTGVFENASLYLLKKITRKRFESNPEVWEMTSSQSTRSPLARLVLFMVCVSIAGSIVAGVHYYAVDLPHQNAVTAPENTASSGQYRASCSTVQQNCISDCNYACGNIFINCVTCHNQCAMLYYLCSLDAKTNIDPTI
jgi:hypothetical protein